MSKISILIVDDHRMFRDGIIALLEKEKDMQVLDEACDGMDALEKIAINTPDVVLMDIDMGSMNGIETTQKIKENYTEVEILALSMHSDTTYIVKMLDAGAKGYILKNAGRDEMVAAIKAVHSGSSYFSSEVSSKLLEQLHSKNTGKERKKDEIPLTDRELEVLNLIAQEYSNPEIAEKLFISIRTVDTHRRNLLEKLGVKNTVGLVKYAISKGLLDD